MQWLWKSRGWKPTPSIVLMVQRGDEFLGKGRHKVMQILLPGFGVKLCDFGDLRWLHSQAHFFEGFTGDSDDRFFPTLYLPTGKVPFTDRITSPTCQ
jgi:hypothetical protein